jgi:chemotaxis protein methyltransferase CheR
MAPDTKTAESLWAAGKAAEAITLLQQITTAQPAEAQAPYLLAKFCANRLQLHEAEDWIEVALQRAPLLAPAHYLRGLILQEGGRPWEALEALRGCIYADPQFVLAHFALAGQFAKLGQAQRARKSLQNVVQLLAGHPRDALIAEGDGLTVGRLLELVAMGKQLTDE